jgi:SMEK domain-containing protein
MITKGHFIGEIIDDLASIAYQVDNRSKMGFTDLNRLLEDFFKDILNKALNLNLINLNQERFNAPGLDLGDTGASIGFQVTSQKTSAKINDTLKALTADQLKAYAKIRVLVIGAKQGSYTLNPDLCAKVQFTESDIWDINDICKLALDVPLDRLQGIYDYVRLSMARVTIELETPNAEGKFPTSIADYIESAPTPTISDFTQYFKFHQSQHADYEFDLKEIRADFAELVARLRRLPRITREFYAMLLEHRDVNQRHHLMSCFSLNYDRLERICRYPDMSGELRLLESEGLAQIEPHDDGESAYVRIAVRGKSDNFHHELVEYVEEKKLTFRKPIVALDFGDF